MACIWPVSCMYLASICLVLGWIWPKSGKWQSIIWQEKVNDLASISPWSSKHRSMIWPLIWPVSRQCLLSMKPVSVENLACIWPVSGEYLATIWIVYGLNLTNICSKSGLFLASIWPVSGEYMACIWQVSGLNSPWSGQYQSRIWQTYVNDLAIISP